MKIYNTEGMPQTQFNGTEALFWVTRIKKTEFTSPLVSNRGQLFLPERDKTPGFSSPPAPSGRSSIPGEWGWALLSSTQTHSEGRSSTSGTTDRERWVLILLPQPFWKTASEATQSRGEPDATEPAQLRH